MKYSKISKLIRPALFLAVGAFFFFRAPLLNTDYETLYKLFGVILGLYAVYRFVQLRNTALSILFILGTLFLSSCGPEQAADDLRAKIYYDSELEAILQTELEVFQKLYPKYQLMIVSQELDLALIKDDADIRGYIGKTMARPLKQEIQRVRSLDIDSIGFIRVPTDSTSTALIKIYEFEPNNGSVKAFASFLTGPRGQLIAIKEGYGAVHPVERDVNIKQDY